ncbi:MAG: hypothetical protein SFU27_11655 [Thermonemataceae bacterium]|nr:hypothetical protein [Thermonemataceae bacterium]
MDSTERLYTAKLSQQKLYLRFFDVDYHPEKGAIPLGNVTFDSVSLKKFDSYVAVCFITNKTMLKIPSDQVKPLAEKLCQKVFTKAKNMPLVGIQLDCDWSEKSQSNFFRLCKEVGDICKKKNIELSATIRLHQYRYPEKTGIPPVKRGVLMLYNMGDINGSATENSIFDRKILESYLKEAPPYPIQLEVALPIFSWAVLKRMGKTTNILQQLRFSDMQSNPHLKKLQKNLYSVTKSHYFGGEYLYEGDLLRWETINKEDLQYIAQTIATCIKVREVIFYHLDTQILNNFSYEELKNLARYWL